MQVGDHSAHAALVVEGQIARTARISDDQKRGGEFFPVEQSGIDVSNDPRGALRNIIVHHPQLVLLVAGRRQTHLIAGFCEKRGQMDQQGEPVRREETDIDTDEGIPVMSSQTERGRIWAPLEVFGDNGLARDTDHLSDLFCSNRHEADPPGKSCLIARASNTII